MEKRRSYYTGGRLEYSSSGEEYGAGGRLVRLLHGAGRLEYCTVHSAGRRLKHRGEKGRREIGSHVSALSVGAYTTSLVMVMMVDGVKGGRRAPPPSSG